MHPCMCIYNKHVSAHMLAHACAHHTCTTHAYALTCTRMHVCTHIYKAGWSPRARVLKKLVRWLMGQDWELELEHSSNSTQALSGFSC